MRVTVEDENDHSPTFGNTHLSLEVPEGQDPQTLTTLRASDPDGGLNGQLQYRILGESRQCHKSTLLGSAYTPGSWPLPVSVNVSVSLSAASVSFLHISVFEAPLQAPPSLFFLYTYLLYPIPFLMFYFYIPFILIFVYILFLYLLFLIYHTVNYPQTSLVSETLTTLCICNGISTMLLRLVLNS